MPDESSSSALVSEAQLKELTELAANFLEAIDPDPRDYSRYKSAFRLKAQEVYDALPGSLKKNFEESGFIAMCQRLCRQRIAAEKRDGTKPFFQQLQFLQDQ